MSPPYVSVISTVVQNRRVEAHVQDKSVDD